VEKKPLPYSTPYLVHDHGHEPAGQASAAEGAAEASPEAPDASKAEPAAPEGDHEHAHEHAPIALDQDFTFTIAYETYPDVALGEYRGIPVEKPEYEIVEEDLQRELKALQEQNALVVDKKEGAVEKGNIVAISYAEIDESGSEKPGTKREGFSFEVGTGYNLYGLDDDVVGLKTGEEKLVEKTFPADYQHSELAGKSVRVKVTLESIREKNLPAIDDELAQDINDKFKSLDDLKKDIRERLDEAAKGAVRSRMVAQIMDSLYQSSTVPLPRSMVSLQLASNWQTLVRQLRGDERAADKYLKSMGRTRESMLEQWKPDAERRLKSSLIVVTVMDREKIETTDDDVAARVKEIAERRSSTEQEVRDRIEKEGALDDLKSQIRERKLEDFLLSVSTVKDGAKMSFLDLVRGNE
jgi:trigger factor